MAKRYRLPLYATRIGTPNGSKEASSDGWFYAKDPAEAAFLEAIGCQADDLDTGVLEGSSGDLATGLAALGITFDENGDIVANVVPRTGTLSALMAVSGSLGELASATDVPAVVRLSGAPNGGKMITPFDGVTTVTLTGSSYGAQTWPCDCGKLVVASAGGTDATTSISTTISNGYVPGQKLEVYISGALDPATFAIAAANGPIVVSGGQLVTLEWCALMITGNAWVIRDIVTIDVYPGTFAANMQGSFAWFGGIPGAISSRVHGASTTEEDAIGTVVHGDGLTIGTPYAMVHGVSNLSGKSAYQQLTCVHASTSAASATELTQNGAAGNGRVNRGVLFPVTSGMYRIEVTIIARAGSTNTWVGTRVIYVRTSTLGAPTIIGSTDTIGTDVAGGVTAPTAITFAAVGGSTRAITISVTPANTTATDWAAAVKVVGLE